MKLVKELQKYWVYYLLLGLVFVIGYYIRIYRVIDILGFYFDQGRDALIIWDLIHKGKFFLIGPTTGIAGIFRGPFYYYLITPFYYFGNGNPVWPANFLSLTAMLGVLILFYLGKEMHSREAGLMGALIATFSYNLFLASQWLSNPTPMMILSMLLVLCLWKVVNGKRYYWMGVTLVVGLSLFHFGSSGELFYFLAIIFVFIWVYWKDRKSIIKIINKEKLIWIGSILLFLLTASPLILFDLRHGFLLSKNIKNFIFSGETFKMSLWEVVLVRLRLYWDVYFNKLFILGQRKELILGISVLVIAIVNFKDLLRNKGFKLVSLILAAPMIGLMFFQGNEGNIYEYYLTGYYYIIILFVGLTLGYVYKQSWFGKIFVFIFLYFFLVNNAVIIKSKLNDNVDGAETIALKNELQAIEWIYKDANGAPFNVDEYVPPVITHSYDYLFLWIGTSKYYLPTEEMIPQLYTLYEADSIHQDKLDLWIARQGGIGTVVKETKFGGITVQRRDRVKYE